MRLQSNRIGTYLFATAVVLSMYVGAGDAAYGQNADPTGMPPDHAAHKGHQSASQAMPKGGATGTGQSVATEIARLKEQVAQLQTALARHDQAAAQTDGQMPKRMGMKSRKSGMGMRGMMGMQGMKGGGMSGMSSGGGMMMDNMEMSGMEPMPSGGGMAGGGMGMMMDNMNMMGMMGGPAASNMKMTAALPGFPGASHIYHIGATGFFLDHPEHITLAVEQQQRLASLRDQAVRAQTEAQRKIDAAEEELWQLTAADQPSLSKIESKIGEIEDLRADQRLDFIEAVGEAAKVLTEPQRQALLGQIPPSGMAQAGAGRQQPGGTGQGMEPMPPSAGMGMGDM